MIIMAIHLYYYYKSFRMVKIMFHAWESHIFRILNYLLLIATQCKSISHNCILVIYNQHKISISVTYNQHKINTKVMNCYQRVSASLDSTPLLCVNLSAWLTGWCSMVVEPVKKSTSWLHSGLLSRAFLIWYKASSKSTD